MNYGIVHYNTPELTTCLIASIKKWDKDAKIFIFENSNKRPLEDIWGNLTIFDNTKGQLIDFEKLIKEAHKYLSPNSWRGHIATKSTNNFGSMKHASSVQWLIENLKDNFLLLDSDVLLKKSPLNLITDKICSGSIDFLTNTIYRIAPYICYLNYNEMIKNNIKFFDIRTFDACYYNKDTGGTFLTEIMNRHLEFNKFNWMEYCVHFGNGSWRVLGNRSNLKNASIGSFYSFLMENKELWQSTQS